VTDLRPLLQVDATEVEKVLLLAGRSDGPRKGAAAQLLAAIDAAPPAPSVPPAAPVSVERVALVRWAKIGLVTLGMGGAAAVAYHVGLPRRAVPSTMPPRPVVSEPAPVAAPGEARAPGEAPLPAAVSPEAGGGVATAREQQPELVAEKDEVRVRKAGRAREASASPLDRSLGEETRALDRAREALDAHRPSEVLRLLDDYHRTFPQGRLRPEAMVLRLAALVQAGKHDAADSLADQLLADRSYRAYAPRIRSLLGKARP
jgi:hypothetical protein